MSDASQREWRFYLDDMIGLAKLTFLRMTSRLAILYRRTMSITSFLQSFNHY
ncbi:hypothetical protein [Megalodesulfovibrio paquesii]